MSQQVTQSISTPLVVLLSKNGLPVEGLAFGDVTAQFLKQGGSFASKTLTALNFAEKGEGVYTITFTTSELNTLGVFVVVVQGADIDQSTTTANIVAAAAATVVPPTAQVCNLFGHVVTPAGDPKQNVAVTAMIYGHPSIEQYSLAVADDAITTVTDANGYFQFNVLRLAEIEVFIPDVDYRRRLTVPNQASANLLTEVP